MHLSDLLILNYLKFEFLPWFCICCHLLQLLFTKRYPKNKFAYVPLLVLNCMLRYKSCNMSFWKIIFKIQTYRHANFCTRFSFIKMTSFTDCIISQVINRMGWYIQISRYFAGKLVFWVLQKSENLKYCVKVFPSSPGYLKHASSSPNVLAIFHRVL